MKKKFDVTSGNTLRCKGWRQEALLRLLENVLSVGENPEKLVVYAALGRAARDWPSYEAIVHALKTMNDSQTLLVQSGKPVALLETHENAPLVIMANCNMVGRWATADNFYSLEKKGLICWGGLTAGDWQYIGSQGVIQGTYEIFVRIAERYYNKDLTGRFILTSGLGGMGGAQPLAGVMANAIILAIDVNQENINKRMQSGFLQHQAENLDQALEMISEAKKQGKSISIALLGNAAEIYPEILKRKIIPDIVTDQTSAHDLIYGYVPIGYNLDNIEIARKDNPDQLKSDGLKSIAKHVQAMLGFMDQGSVVFDNGNLIRPQAYQAGVKRAFDIPIFTEAFLRPLFCRSIGPFRWVALSNNSNDIDVIDNYILERFSDNSIISNWIKLAQKYVPFEGLPARIAWLGHGERTELALAVNKMVADGCLSAPIAFTRDHLDAGAMAHPNIMTEKMKDGSDAIADWPLLNALTNCSSMADLVAIHSGGGGYSGYMTSSGVTVVADGTPMAEQRLKLSMTNDTSTGVVRYADAGYPEALDEIEKKNIGYIKLDQ